MHRRVTAGTFTEKNSALVFGESISQARSMLDSWTAHAMGKMDGEAAIRSVHDDTMRLALHIISYVAFGLRLLWPGQGVPADSDPRWAKYGQLEAPEGFSMSFAGAVATMLNYLLPILLLPQWLMSRWWRLSVGDV